MRAVEWKKDRGGRGSLRTDVGDVHVEVSPRRRGGYIQNGQWVPRTIAGWGWRVSAIERVLGCFVQIERKGSGDSGDLTPASAQALALAAVENVQRAVDALRDAERAKR